MFKTERKTLTPSYRKCDKDGRPLYNVPIDQFPAQSFNLGANGFPANDITLLMKATTDKEFEMIAARLQAVKVNNPDNSGKSDKQLIKELIPSWVQSPAEIERFMDWYNKANPVESPVSSKEVKQEVISTSPEAEK